MSLSVIFNILPVAIAGFLQIYRLPEPAQPSESQRPARALSLEQLHIRIQIAGPTAMTEVEQVFRNRSSAPSEEIYIWPIPEGASVSDFQLWIDGKAQQAEILDKNKARGVYENIVRSKRDPALLEWAGFACVRCSVFPVPANGEGRVKLKYIHSAAATANIYEYVMPMRTAAIAPEGIRSMTIQGTIDSPAGLASIYSPTHALDIRQTGDRSAKFSYEGNHVARDKDFILTFAAPDRDFGALLLAHRSPGADGYFSLTLNPRFDLAPGTVLPKNIIFVVDTSGSMNGAKLAQAQAALLQCVAGLNKEDQFALFRFSTDVETMSGGFLENNPANIQNARQWIQSLAARGGTNIDEALSAAMKLAKSTNRMSMIFFLTDGLPTVGEADTSRIAARVRADLEQQIRIFTFGVGFDVNTQLLDEISKVSRGAREYVRPEENVELKVASLFEKVSNPVLSNVSISCEGAAFFDVYPRQIPDLFKGSQLLLTGRFRGEGPRDLLLRGRFGNASREFTFKINLPAVEEKYDSLGPLWAMRKVGFLLDEIRLRGANPELVDEVRRLGKEHNIVTPYTSFLVVEESRRLASARGVPQSEGRHADGDGSELYDRENADAVRDRLSELKEKVSGEEAVENSKAADDLSRAKSPGGLSGPKPPSAGGRDTGSGVWGGGRSGAPNSSKDNVEALAARYTRSTGGRVFRMIQNTWIDSTFTENDRAKIIKVKFLSKEYFDLLAADASLNACFSLGTRIVVKSQGVFYEIEP